MIITPGMLINLLILFILLGLVFYVLKTLTLPPPWPVVIQVVAVLLAFILILRLFIVI